jgi:hypothetical protein
MRLISLTYSHYVERARWCLDLLGEEYEEEHNIGIAGLLLQVRLSHGRAREEERERDRQREREREETEERREIEKRWEA